MTAANHEVTVRVFEVRAEAEIAVARLAADGIDAAIRQDDEGGLNPGFYKRYGVRVVLQSESLEDAYTSLGVERLGIRRPLLDAMFQHAAWGYPSESCGLVAFDAAGPALVICLTNAIDAPDRFVIDPVEHFGAQSLADRLGMTIGGIFHSHPGSDAFPSRHDIEGGGDPDWIHFIAGPMNNRPTVRAFRIEGSVPVEVSLDVQP